MSGTRYFQNFPSIPYQFGSGESPVKFQNLSVYIDAFDQVKEIRSFYQNYFIGEGQRPDQLSYDLYGTTDYYWTFFLINDHLRTSGWPLASSSVYPKSKEYYPNVVITTDGTSFNNSTGDLVPLCRSETFASGTWVYLSTVKKAVKVMRINQDLGQIYLQMSTPPTNEGVIHTITQEDAEIVNNVNPDYIPSFVDTTNVHNVLPQYDAIHHYEDAEGNWVNPSNNSTAPYSFIWSSVSSAQSVSYFQRLREINLANRAISVLKPDTVIQVVGEFNQLLKNRR
jgi:hypothetical protein